MSDEDDTKDRLANRFESDDDGETNAQTDTNESSSWNARNEWNPSSVKEDWTGNTVYLPDTLDGAFDDEFDRLRYELDREIGKGRHYNPLVVSLGLRELASMDAEEIEATIEAMVQGEIDDETA